MTVEALYQIFLDNPFIQTDTRHITKGGIFFALKGPNFNGNQFSQLAIDNGASYAVIDDQKFQIEGKTIFVGDVLETLQQLAQFHRKKFNIPFIAITGSNGKTTTKELVHAVLSTQYLTYTTQGNLNNHIGIPLTLLKIKKDAQMAVIEMGANHLKEIESYCKIAQPGYGLITNCGKAHLEGFGGEQGVRQGKGELFDYLRQTNGVAFIMQDYPYLQEMSKGISIIHTYGTKNAGLTGTSVKDDPYLMVEMHHGMKGFIKTSLVGGYNLPNVLAAAALGLFFNVPEDRIKKAIEHYQPNNSRSQLLQKNTNKIILDAYNANPNSLMAAIENFASSEGSSKYLILGSMAELGNSSQEEHQNIVSAINKNQWKGVLLVGDEFKKINHGYHQFETAVEAGEWLKTKKINHSFILIKGSRSMQMEKVLDYI
ncbi:MAG: UDP-N-acetylmuramoyl-tripeptide--D-alanyl-D-alanine ligase [Flavisolibacter sp.]